jgi:hypothetical protein
VSGGSFNYLYCQRGAELLARLLGRLQRDHLLEIAELGDLPGAAEALARVDRLLVEIEAELNRPPYVPPPDLTMEGLANVFQAIEWHRSSDWGPERVVEALARLKTP